MSSPPSPSSAAAATSLAAALLITVFLASTLGGFVPGLAATIVSIALAGYLLRNRPVAEQTAPIEVHEAKAIEPEKPQVVEPEVVVERPKNLPPDFRRKQILVVDREAATLDFTAELLRKCGARVTIARSATEAILALYQHHDLVITDNGVVVSEGVMLSQQLRQANGGLPSIVLQKPIDAAALTSEVAQVFTRSGAA